MSGPLPGLFHVCSLSEFSQRHGELLLHFPDEKTEAQGGPVSVQGHTASEEPTGYKIQASLNSEPELLFLEWDQAQKCLEHLEPSICGGRVSGRLVSDLCCPSLCQLLPGLCGNVKNWSVQALPLSHLKKIKITQTLPS